MANGVARQRGFGSGQGCAVNLGAMRQRIIGLRGPLRVRCNAWKPPLSGALDGAGVLALWQSFGV